MARTSEVYKWRPGSRFRVPARVVGPELSRIEESVRAEGRELTPVDVVDAARPEASPLHRLFEWDNQIAADKFRLVQARQIIRCIEVSVHQPQGKPDVEMPAFTHVAPSGSPCYAATRRVLRDDELRELALGEAASLLEGVRMRFARLGELHKVIVEIDAFLADQKERRKAGRKK